MVNSFSNTVVDRRFGYAALHVELGFIVVEMALMSQNAGHQLRDGTHKPSLPATRCIGVRSLSMIGLLPGNSIQVRLPVGAGDPRLRDIHLGQLDDRSG